MKKILTIAFLFSTIVLSGQTYSNPTPAASIDAFGRQRVSEPQALFDAQFTYDLQPLLFEQITSSGNCTVTHDATNRLARLDFSSATSSEEVVMQTFEHFRYQPGKSQDIKITFNMYGGVANNTKYAGYSDGTNGIEFAIVDGAPVIRILSETGSGNQSITQDNWNLNRLDWTTGDTLDITKVQILVIDFQALYVGRVRVGFERQDKGVVYVHKFEHVNSFSNPYFQTANLPVRVGMTASGTVTDSIEFICSSIISEGGQEVGSSFEFVQEATVTAGNETRTHLISIRPDTLFNGITNRSKISLSGISLLVIGANPVKWELVLGQGITGTTTFSEVNSTYSAVDYNAAGTISGDPTIVIDQGYVPASNQSDGVTFKEIPLRYPITLDAVGNARVLGTVSLIVTGIGGTSALRGGIHWAEIR